MPRLQRLVVTSELCAGRLDNAYIIMIRLKKVGEKGRLAPGSLRDKVLEMMLLSFSFPSAATASLSVAV